MGTRARVVRRIARIRTELFHFFPVNFESSNAPLLVFSSALVLSRRLLQHVLLFCTFFFARHLLHLSHARKRTLVHGRLLSTPHDCIKTMNPSVWGPSFWFVMHTVSLNYPDEPSFVERRAHYDFYYNIRNILPCEMCREHYRELIKQYPIQPFLDSKSALVSWVVMIHNQVNKRLGKPTIDRNDMLANYQQVYERKSFCDPACPAPADGQHPERSALRSNGLHDPSPSVTQRVLVGVCVAETVVLVLLVVLLFVAWRRGSTGK